MAVNVQSVYLGAKYAVPVMAAAAAGRSCRRRRCQGWPAIPRGVVYSASKAAVINLTRARLACSPRPPGVRVNCICPGAIDTPPVGRMCRGEAAGERSRGAIRSGGIGWTGGHRRRRSLACSDESSLSRAGDRRRRRPHGPVAPPWRRRSETGTPAQLVEQRCRREVVGLEEFHAWGGLRYFLLGSAPCRCRHREAGSQSSWWLSSNRAGRTAATWRATKSASEPWIGSPSMLPRPAAARIATSARAPSRIPVQWPGRVLEQQRRLPASRTGRASAPPSPRGLWPDRALDECCTSRRQRRRHERLSSAIRSCCSCHVTPRSPMHTSSALGHLRCATRRSCAGSGRTVTVTSCGGDPLAAGDADHPLGRHAGCLHHADASRSCR